MLFFDTVLPMITERIARGALRTKNLALRSLHTSALRAVHLPKRMSPGRAATLIVVAARMSFAPVPVVQAAAVGAADQDGLPPSTVAAVSFSPTAAEPLIVTRPGLTPVHVQIVLPTPQTSVASVAPTPVVVTQVPVVRKSVTATTYAVVSQPTGALASEISRRITLDRGAVEAEALMFIAERESGVSLNSYNQSSGACGIWQALPCSKMGGMDLEHQYNWVRGYALGRYGSYVNAKAFWITHRYW